MEEQVGLWWHRLITRWSEDRHPAASVPLSGLGRELGVLYRAFGGVQGLALDAVAPTRVRKEGLLKRISGADSRLQLASFDDQALRLPHSVDAYPDAALNRDLYRWWAALAAVVHDCPGDALQANQQGTLRLLAHYPGIAAIYRRLVLAEIERRGDAGRLSRPERAAEMALRKALLLPGSLVALPAAYPAPQPVLLWLTRLGRAAPSAPAGDPDRQDQAAPMVQKDRLRRRSQQPGGPARKGGLLIFRPESIFSWTEYARTEHEIQENGDEDLSRAADDLETLSIGDDPWRVSKKLEMNLEVRERIESDAEPREMLLRIPEWDYRKNCLRADRCAVHVLPRSPAAGCELPEALRRDRKNLQKLFSAIIPNRRMTRGQTDGTDIDLDACIRARTDRHRDRQVLYQSPNRHLRDMSCLLLADLSLSTDAGLSETVKVIDMLRDSLVLFAESLALTRDRLAVLGFNLRGRHHVRIAEIKRFDERYDEQVRQRMIDVKPAYYTRMGAAIRYATLQLRRECSSTKLLLLLTDGKPNDQDDYAIVRNPRELPRKLTRLYAQLTRSVH